MPLDDERDQASQRARSARMDIFAFPTTPFFDDRTKAPRAVPRALAQSGRAAL
jgi:hypothetical protein